MISVYVVIWIMVSIIIMGIGAFIAGKKAPKDPNAFYDDSDAMLMITFIIAAAWPLVLLVMCAASPFIGLYYLGKSFAKNDS